MPCANWIDAARKRGAGYYDYDEERNRTPSKITAGIISEVTGNSEPLVLSEEEILATCIFPMINEGAEDSRGGQGAARQ